MGVGLARMEHITILQEQSPALCAQLAETALILLLILRNALQDFSVVKVIMVVLPVKMATLVAPQDRQDVLYVLLEKTVLTKHPLRQIALVEHSVAKEILLALIALKDTTVHLTLQAA